MRQSVKTAVRKRPTNGRPPSVAEMQARIDALEAELSEALEQQSATGEVLQVINSSPGDLTPVFDAILEKAHSLCGSTHGCLVTFDGECFRAVATHGLPGRFVELVSLPYRPYPGSLEERLVLGDVFAHIPDVAAMASLPDNPISQAAVDLTAVRTVLLLPLRKDGTLLGYISAHRQEVRPFTDKQIALLQNFAAQAVIAMENARLSTETREALEQQTATAQVLGVINSSPGDLAPVFDAMLEKALTLCGADQGILRTFDGEAFHVVAISGGDPASVERVRQLGPVRSAEDRSFYGRLAQGERVVHIIDARETDTYRNDPKSRERLEARGIRSWLAVALQKEDVLLGALVIHRSEVRPFSHKQIALLQNFAAQAVIAMENARLLTETREALEQQTATAEVLEVINSSPGQLGPVFDAMLDKALHLCGAAFGILWTFDGEFVRAAAVHGATAEYAEFLTSTAHRPGVDNAHGRLLRGEEFVHIADVAADAAYHSEDPVRRATVELGGARTLLAVALRKEGVVLGIFVIYRREVQLFSEKEIALLQNFAAQAVIAMENARLLGELRQRTSDLEESLEYQTATSNVLQVISRSTFDLQPVLDTLVETAARLCDAESAAVAMRRGDDYRYVSTFSINPEWVAMLRDMSFEPGRGSVTGRALLERRLVHVADIASDPEHAVPQVVTVGNLRTMLSFPLLREDETIGVLTLARQRVEPFSERQIELVNTFADQAVIAIENTRLLTELRESLEQQQAIAEVLGVINSSPGELEPVFDAILENAHSLCGIAAGSLELFDGERFRAVAVRGLSDAFAEMLRQGYPASDNPATRPLIEGGRFAHIRDLAETEYAITRSGVELDAARTLLCVPLRRDETLLGMIACARREVRLFSEKEIALLESFAAQAVIAMDNARLLNEIRQRQAELRVTFDNMGDGVAMFDDDLRLAAWNQNFRQMLDLPEEFLAERPSFAEYFRYLAERGEFASADLEAQLARTVEDTERELRFERTRPDGRVIEVRRNAVPGGGFVMIYSDVTERKRAEAEIRAARDAAETALKELQTTQASLIHAQKMAALGQLTAGIAHEIKNPLNFVNNFAGLSVELLDELKEAAAPWVATLDENTRAEIDETVQILTSNLEKIADHGNRADGIVKSMLEHSRGGSDDRRSVNLNTLIDEALNLAYHGARAQDQTFNIALERDFAAGLAPIEVVPQDITRVFLNLFGNGFYAANLRKQGRGRDFLPTLKVATGDLGEAVEIRVRDNGIGIAPEIRDKLFQPFVTTKPTGEGTGLGLSISYDIVTQQHGGTIEVDSEPGEFTEFTIRLPRRRGSARSGTAA
jgi:two-component system, NtrC family, sensor kinase